MELEGLLVRPGTFGDQLSSFVDDCIQISLEYIAGGESSRVGARHGKRRSRILDNRTKEIEEVTKCKSYLFRSQCRIRI